jgi:DNA-binding NtrC family response regulator
VSWHTTGTQHWGEQKSSGLYLEVLNYQQYDAIITDISMPGVGGLHILKRIQVRQLKTPVIVISGSGDEFRDLFMEMGAFAYFTKPFRLRELELAVSQAIARHQQRRAGGNLNLKT